MTEDCAKIKEVNNKERVLIQDSANKKFDINDISNQSLEKDNRAENGRTLQVAATSSPKDYKKLAVFELAST